MIPQLCDPSKRNALATMTAQDILKWTNLPELRITQIAGMTITSSLIPIQFLNIELIPISRLCEYQPTTVAGLARQTWNCLESTPIMVRLCICICLCICLCICICICICILCICICICILYVYVYVYVYEYEYVYYMYIICDPSSCCVHGCIHFFDCGFDVEPLGFLPNNFPI